MKRPPLPRSLLVEHAALPRPFDAAPPRGSADEVRVLDRDGRLRVAVQLVALAALLAEFELWLPRWALRRARAEPTDGGVRAKVPAMPVPLSRLTPLLGGGEIADERARRALLASVAEVTDLGEELPEPGPREPGLVLDGVLERLLRRLPRPLDDATAEALWMLRWSLPPLPENGDTTLYELGDRSTAIRIGAASWAAAARNGRGADLLVARRGGRPETVATLPGGSHLRVICGAMESDWLAPLVEEAGPGRGAVLVIGSFPRGWRPPPAPVFDRGRLAAHLTLAGVSPARRLHWLDRHRNRFDPCSRADRSWLTRTASNLFADPGRRRRGRFEDLVRVARLLPEGVPVDRALELAGCDRERLAAAEDAQAVVVRGERVLAEGPRELRLDALHLEVVDLVAGEPARGMLHRALASGDAGELLRWGRAGLDELRAAEVREVLGPLAPGALGPGVQTVLAEACLSLADIHGADRALTGLDHEIAGPWRAWLGLLDRPPELEVALPGPLDVRQAPRAAAEIALVALRRALRQSAEAADEASAVVRSAAERLRGPSRRWVEIRRTALLEPARLDDRAWRREAALGHPELNGLVLFERSVRAALDGRTRLARRLLERVMSFERAPGRLALMHVNLGFLAFDEGRGPEAEALTLRALRLFQAAGFRHRTWEVLHNLAVADIDRLRVARAAERLDQVAAGRNSLFVAVERARLELAVGNLDRLRARLDALPELDEAPDPDVQQALSLLHGVLALLDGRRADALARLRGGGQEGEAWIELAEAMAGRDGAGGRQVEADGWGVRRAADLVRAWRRGDLPVSDVNAGPGPAAPCDALAVALARRLALGWGWPDRERRRELADVLEGAGLSGWAATLRWTGAEVPDVLGALSDLARGREPDGWPEARRRALLDVLGVDGLVVRSTQDGGERWRLGDGPERAALPHGRIELVSLGREPSPGPGWRLVSDLSELGVPTVTAAAAGGDRPPVRLDGSSSAMAALRNEVRRTAGTRFTVLIQGETGSGKEVVAREIHRLSGRAGELVAVNVAAIPVNLLEAELFGSLRGAFTGAERSRRGLVAAADGGTLFLDEIGDLDMALQVKLLRFLESGEVRAVGSDRTTTVDVRVICATHRNLDRLVREGRFRQDLYYRIAVARVMVPALRERPEDIPKLVAIFEREAVARHGLPGARWSAAAEGVLRTHLWPGNVRELKHTVEVAMARAGGQVVRPEHLPIPTPAPASRGTWEQVLGDCKRRLIEEVLGRHRGNRSAAARELGITRQALLYQLKALGLTDL